MRRTYPTTPSPRSPRLHAPAATRPMEALEPRVMLANTAVFTDADGDQVTVKLTGPGTATPTLSAGATGFIDSLALTGTTTDSALTISVKKLGGDGRVKAVNVDGAFLKSLIAPTTDFSIGASAAFQGITRFITGDIPDGTGFTLVTPAGKPVAIACKLLGGNLVINGAVSSLKAFSVFSSATVNTSSTMGPITATSGLGGDWRANSYASITTGADLSGGWRARTPNAKGYTFGAIKAQSINGLLIDADVSQDFGRIASLTVALSLVNAQIIALGLDTLKVAGFAELDLDLKETDPAKFAMKSATILGSLDGQWDMQSRIGTLRVGQTLQDFDLEASDTAGHIGSITFLGNQFSRGNWDMASLGSLKSAGPVGGDWTIFSTIPGSNLGLKTATPVRFLNMNMLLQNGGLGSLTTQEILDSDVVAPFFKTLSLKPGGQGLGDLLGTNVRAMASSGDGSTNQWSIVSMTVKGKSEGSFVFTRSNVKTMAFGRLLGAGVYVGSTNPFSNQGAFGNTAQLDSSRRLESISITAPFDLANFAFDTGSEVRAAAIGKVLINGNVNRAAGQPLGFVSGAFTSIKMRSTTGAALTVSPPGLGLGDTNPFAPTASDFIFRVVPL